MWQEARKQEKKIRGMLVDYRRRAERRQDFYERIKADPTQFMQVHGRKSKIHLDPAVAIAGDSATIMMPWQGQKDNIIDRFDARAHLDFIPPLSTADAEDNPSNDDRVANYERYRILAQNEFLGISEEKFLQQLYLEEQYGVNAQQEAERTAAKKAQKPQTGAAIGYTYEDSTGDYPSLSGFMPSKRAASPADDDEDSDSDLDVDVCININKLDVTQGNELNKFGRNYGMLSNDFYSFLTRDADEADAMRLAREEEQEKVLMGGRKSRRERRAQREKKFTRRFQSPPSYASKEEDFRDLLATKSDPKDEHPKRSDENESRSPSPVNSGVITYITSFGGDDETPGPSATGALKPGKSQTMTKLQQLKSQLTLGSIIGEKRDALAASGNLSRGGNSKLSTESVPSSTARPKITTSSTTAGRAEIIGKPVSYRGTGGDRRNKSPPRRFSRSRSRSRVRRDRHRRHSVSSRSSRSRSVSSRSRSSSRERRRGYNQSDRRRRSLSRGRQERRGRQSRRRSPSYSSDSSSSTSGSSASRRSYSRRNSRSCKKSPTPKLKPQPRQMEKSPTKENPKSVPKVESPEPSAVKLPEEVVVVVTKPAAEIPISVPVAIPVVSDEVQVPVKKYYGRKKDDHSDSELSYSEEEKDKAKEGELKTTAASVSRNVERQQKTESNSTPSSSRSRAGGSSESHRSGSTPALVKSGADEYKATQQSTGCNPRDRLKRKMQSLLNKQYKADKKAEHEKSERQLQIQQERNEEMRELAIKLRKRQRELRHKTEGAGEQSSGEDDEDVAAEHQLAVEDEEERLIQARLHKLVAMSRNNDVDAEYEDFDRSTSRNDYRRERPSDRRRDWHDDQDDYAKEKRSRRGDSRERSFSSQQQSRRRERSSSRPPRSSRWDAQERHSPHATSSSGSHRNLRLVDY